MKKTTILITLILLLGGGYLVITKNSKDIETNFTDKEVSIENTNLVSPERPAEINGSVLSVEGNILIIANEIGKEQLTEEERAKRKEEMQNLPQEERQALRQQELENTEKEDIEIVIPVGISIAKGGGDASGNNVSAEISEIIKGTYVSVWVKENNVPEFVKIKGLSQ